MSLTVSMVMLGSSGGEASTIRGESCERAESSGMGSIGVGMVIASAVGRIDPSALSLSTSPSSTSGECRPSAGRMGATAMGESGSMGGSVTRVSVRGGGEVCISGVSWSRRGEA